MKDKIKDKRLREGCLVCKLRHVKCDGNRPECLNCRGSGRTCKGFPPLPRSAAASAASAPRTGAASTSLILHSGVSPRSTWSQKELRSFSYGLQKTLPQMTTYFDSELWGRQIPRLAHSVPAIRHALSALASFHEKSKPNDHLPLGSPTNGMALQPVYGDQFFVQQYNKAIKGISQHFKGQGLSKHVCVLTCCALFVCLEGFHRRTRAMINHFRNGLQVFHEWVALQNPDTKFYEGSIEAAVYETFRRIDLHLAAFIEGHIPSAREIVIVRNWPLADITDPIFTCIPQIRLHIDILYGKTFLFLTHFNSPSTGDMPVDKLPLEVTFNHQLLLGAMAKSAAALEKYCSENEPTFSPKEQRSITLLRIRNTILSVFACKWPHEHATHSELEPDLQVVIDLARLMIREHMYGTPIPSSDSEHSPSSVDSPPELKSNVLKRNDSVSASSTVSVFDEPPLFTLEIGLLPILYYVALASSTLSIKQDAVHLMRSANLHEGLWSSSRAADMAEQKLTESNWSQVPMTGFEMADLTRTLWIELKTEEEEDGIWA